MRSMEAYPRAAMERAMKVRSESKPVMPGSRVIWLKLDPSSKTATLIRSLDHPDHLSVLSQGSAQPLDNGNTLVGWGEPGRFPEFDANGRMIFDATLPKGYDTYRAYRFRWPPDQRVSPNARESKSARQPSDHHESGIFS